MADLPVPRIELYQYKGKYGSYTDHRQLLWKCDVIGKDNSRRRGNDHSWHGHPSKEYPQREAWEWFKLTGWPIVDLEHTPDRDEKPTDEERRLSR